MTLTLDQKRALAIAAAKVKLAQAKPAGPSADALDRAAQADAIAAQQMGVTDAGQPTALQAMADQAMRQAGLTGRALAQGAASLGGIAVDPITATVNYAAGTNIPTARAAASDLLTRAGVPSPETTAERIAGAGMEGLASAAGGVGLAGLASRAPGVIGAVGSAMAEAPTAQAMSGIGAGLAGQSTAEAGGGPVAQTLASLAGGIFGATVPAAVNFGGKMFRQASSAKPSIESLRVAKNAAYADVDKAGDSFTPDELSDLITRAQAGLADFNFVPEADVNTAGVMKMLEAIAPRGLTLGELDKVRQKVWTRYNTSKEPGLREIIDTIDDTIASHAASSEVMDAARLANSRFKKAEMLDDAMTKAMDQTAATGSGGNVNNKFRQAVSSIINNKKNARWFNADEIEQMRKFVQGGQSENTLRLIGKLSPSGNGLMLALNLGAVAVNPVMALAGAAGAGAKAVADNQASRGMVDLISMAAGQGKPAAGASVAPFAAGVSVPGVAAQASQDRRPSYMRWGAQ